MSPFAWIHHEFQIVREQCWLNETLLACQWTTEVAKSEEDVPDTSQVTEDDLQAVLSGSVAELSSGRQLILD